MNIILDDVSVKELLYPFAQVKSVADIRMGILTIREKWEQYLNKPVGLVSTIKDKSTESVIIPANIIPSSTAIELLLTKGQDAFLKSDAIRLIHHPVDMIKNNAWALSNDFEWLVEQKNTAKISATNVCINPSKIFIESGAKVEYAILNASQGPIYIGKNAEVMEGSMIRGPFASGEESVVKMGAKIYGATTVGPQCVVAGEIKNSILLGYSNKAHDGYLGDSVIGEWCNLGAGTTNSNVKNSAGLIKIWDNASKQWREASNKCGLFMGDYGRSAINTRFNTGTVVGICCNIFDEKFPPKYVPDFSWGNEKYQLTKIFSDIENWKKLKGKYLSETEKETLTTLFNQS